MCRMYTKTGPDRRFDRSETQALLSTSIKSVNRHVRAVCDRHKKRCGVKLHEEALAWTGLLDRALSREPNVSGQVPSESRRSELNVPTSC